VVESLHTGEPGGNVMITGRNTAAAYYYAYFTNYYGKGILNFAAARKVLV